MNTRVSSTTGSPEIPLLETDNDPVALVPRAGNALESDSPTPSSIPLLKRLVCYYCPNPLPGPNKTGQPIFYFILAVSIVSLLTFIITYINYASKPCAHIDTNSTLSSLSPSSCGHAYMAVIGSIILASIAGCSCCMMCLVNCLIHIDYANRYSENGRTRLESRQANGQRAYPVLMCEPPCCDDVHDTYMSHHVPNENDYRTVASPATVVT